MRPKPSRLTAHLAALAFIAGVEPCPAAEAGGLPAYLADRGDAIPTSLFGTYVAEKEFLFYPFYEYTRRKNFEYQPSDFGLTGQEKFFGRVSEREALIFLAYAFNDSLAVEFESAVHSSIDFTKAPGDTTSVPSHLRESGLGDTETNIRWRFLKETSAQPEMTLFFKTVFPLQKSKKLLGTGDWQFAPGIVLTKGFSFGTLAVRAAAAYNTGEHQLEFGEYGVDYLKRLSPDWRIALSIEGEQDELSIIGEVQYTLSKNAILKINSGFGVTKKARGVAPEVGVLFRF